MVENDRPKDYTWIRNLDDLVLLDSGQLDGPDHGSHLQSGKEVGQEAQNVDSDGLVHVDDVLQREVAEVEGQSVPAKPLDQLQVVERVGHARRNVRSGADPSNVAPGKLVRAVEREQGCEPDAVAQI